MTTPSKGEVSGEAIFEQLVLLTEQNVAKEIMLAALVQRLGGSVVITRSELALLKKIVGDAKDIAETGGALTREKTQLESGEDAVRLSIKPLGLRPGELAM